MVNKKIFKIIGIITVVLIVFFFGGVRFNNWIEWRMSVEAVGTMPYQIGLTRATVLNCFTVGTPPICQGGTLCYIKDPGTCLAYSDVSGVQAGGMGSNALFSNAAIARAGLTSGGQLIAGGSSPALMDNGVLASAGGCYGCIAKAGLLNEIKEKFEFVIAGFKTKN